MLPTLYESLTFAADLVVLLFAIYYVFELRRREKSIEKKEKETDLSYHHILNDALDKERGILNDAASEADHMLMTADFSAHDTQENIQNALQQMSQKMQQESIHTASILMNSYSDTLKQLTANSLADFQTIVKGLEGDMQKQTALFRESLLPNLEKELENYKAMRIKQSEATITKIIQQVAQDVLNKSLSMDDHQKLLIDALEKAKTEGVFS